MKKITSLPLAVVLLVTVLSVFGVPAMAEVDEPVEYVPEYGNFIDITNSGNYIISEDYTVSHLNICSGSTLTIAQNASISVTGQVNIFNGARIDLLGTLNMEECDNVYIGGMVYVDCRGTILESIPNPNNIVYDEHDIVDGICSVCGKTKCEAEGHSYEENNVCITCGKTRCDAEGHHLDNGICRFCGYLDESKHEHIFDDYCNCVCGKTKCDVEGHIIDGRLCIVCGFICRNGFHNGIFECKECGAVADFSEKNLSLTSSALSEGSLTIVCTVSALAIGLGGGFLLGKKKKKPAQESEE